MNKMFIEDLKSSPYYSRIFKNHEVVMLFISGSRLLKVTDERSDYDLVVLTNEQTRTEHVDEFLTYEGVKVHWHYVPLMKYISNEDGTAMSCFGQALFTNLTDDAVIYANPKYLDVIDYFKNNRAVVARVAAYRLTDYHGHLIRSVLQSGEIVEKNYCKFLYHLCYASYLLTGDELNEQLIAEIKRIRWRHVDYTFKATAAERIRLLREYVEAHPLDVQAQIDRFNYELGSLLN